MSYLIMMKEFILGCTILLKSPRSAYDYGDFRAWDCPKCLNSTILKGIMIDYLVSNYEHYRCINQLYLLVSCLYALLFRNRGRQSLCIRSNICCWAKSNVFSSGSDIALSTAARILASKLI